MRITPLLSLLALFLAAGCPGPTTGSADTSPLGLDAAVAAKDAASPARDAAAATDASDSFPDADLPDATVDTDAALPPDAAHGRDDAGLPLDLTPAEIGFEDKNPPLTGSFIYYGNWGVNLGDKDTLEMILPDGSQTATRFLVNRLWAWGIANDKKTVAFSSVDPYEEDDWGVTIGDAIQYSWIFRPGQAPVQITRGSINDECFDFMPGDQVLLMCRRANFWQTATDIGNDPYRILTVDIATGTPTFLTALSTTGTSDIGPARRDDGTILFWRQEFVGGKPVHSLLEMQADGSGITTLLASGTSPRTSPDGTKVLFRSTSTWRTLSVAPSHDLSQRKTVTTGGVQSIFGYDFSPDLSQVVFTVARADANCEDIYTVNMDGTSRTRLLDCVTANKYPSGVRWVQIP